MAVIATIPVWMLGEDTGAVVLTVLSLNTSTGELDDGSPGANDAATLTGLLDGVDIRPRRNTQNLGPLNRTRAHHYPVTVGYDLVLQEIMGYGHNSGPYSNCFLGNAWFAGRSAYARCTLVRQSRTYTFIGTICEYDEDYVAGKNVAQLTMRPCGIAFTLA